MLIKKVEKTVIKYVTKDGKEFETWDDANLHELKMSNLRGELQVSLENYCAWDDGASSLTLWDSDDLIDLISDNKEVIAEIIAWLNVTEGERL